MPINLLYRESSTETPPSEVSVKDAPLTSLEVDANFKSISEFSDDLDDRITDNESEISKLSVNKAPTDHASAGVSYGVGTDTKYGHLKVVDSGNYTASTSIAASPKLVSDAVDNYKTEFEAILDNLIGEYS